MSAALSEKWLIFFAYLAIFRPTVVLSCALLFSRILKSLGSVNSDLDPFFSDIL